MPDCARNEFTSSLVTAGVTGVRRCAASGLRGACIAAGAPLGVRLGLPSGVPLGSLLRASWRTWGRRPVPYVPVPGAGAGACAPPAAEELVAVRMLQRSGGVAIIR